MTKYTVCLYPVTRPTIDYSRDVNFREFYFSIREFQISRLVEYSKLNAALGDGPWRSPRSRSPPLPSPTGN